jgi:hypothetical protein
MNIIKALFTWFLVLSLHIGCTQDPIESRILEVKNPTKMIFPFAKDTLKLRIVDMFQKFRHIYSESYGKIFHSYTNDGMKVIIDFVPQTSAAPTFARDYFRDKNKWDDIYLYNNGFTWLSPIYFTADDGPLPFRSSYVIKLTSRDSNQTEIEIFAVEPVVIHGTVCCGPHGRYGKEVPVKPTTIEEYSLLLFIAEQLRIQAPSLKLPVAG